ncbi:hypothetical protein ONS96_014580 [Cadophora gregata f. sp. sojae]|nr:hypothetical protein ONS96_014580 [Cadophora gregata f. sp. sojae]
MFPSAEEKKQRNRDSQAAFRERRKEHISELENIVQEQKEKLQELKNAQASAKEEVLILKYKNSLLERILLEQGIDVNAELNNILVFPPQLPEKRVHRERVLLRPDAEAVASKKAVAMNSSPKTTSECCHCSSSRPQSSPVSQSTTPSTLADSISATTDDGPRKRVRHHNNTDTRAHKHQKVCTPPLHKYRAPRRYQDTNYPAPDTFISLHSPTPKTTPAQAQLQVPEESSELFPSTFIEPLDPRGTTSSTLIFDEESDTTQSVWAPTPPLPAGVFEHKHRHVAAKTQVPAKAFNLDFDFEADFSFGSFAEASSGFDMDLGFLSSVHV